MHGGRLYLKKIILYNTRVKSDFILIQELGHTVQSEGTLFKNNDSLYTYYK